MKIRRLTPAVLKKIIAEEKAKIKNQKNLSRKTAKRNKSNLIEQKVNELTKLALLEAREKIRIKKIKRARELIKKSLK